MCVDTGVWRIRKVKFGIDPRTENNVPIFATWNAFSLIFSVLDVNCMPIACLETVMFLFTALTDNLNAFSIISSPSNNPPAIIRFIGMLNGLLICALICARSMRLRKAQLDLPIGIGIFLRKPRMLGINATVTYRSSISRPF